MKAPALLAVLGAALAGFALADGPADADPAEVARQCQRDRGLLKALVERGVGLSAEADPLRRADLCNELAEELARELGHSTADRDMLRASALGGHLRTLLKRGVASNVEQGLLGGTARKGELQLIWQKTDQITRSAEEGLRDVPSDLRDKLDGIRKDIREGRAAVEQVVEGKAPVRGKRAAPGK